MNFTRAWFTHTVLLTAAGVLALCQSAHADNGARNARTLGLTEIEITDAPLPTSLNTWTETTDESDLKESLSLSLAALPQGRLSQKPSFFDFSKFEMGAFVGAVDYSADFKAHLSYVFGITARVPMPGMPLGDWGLWSEVWVAGIDRNLPFYYSHKSGTWFGLAAGADYTIIKGKLGYIRAQLAVTYANWNNVNSLDNGLGIMLGAQIGLFWIRDYDKSMMTFTPQFHFDGSDHFIFLPIGFSIDF